MRDLAWSSLPQRGSVRAWILASRPATLSASVVPVLVGSACAAAAGGFRLGPAAAALAGAVLIQIGANFANDVFDFESGADGADRLGPVRAAQSGLLSPRALRAGMVAAFGAATAAGAYLAAVAGWPVIAIGVAAIASAVAYTAGPYPLGYHGLGDVFVLVFFGFVAVCGTAYVQVGHIPAVAWWAAIPVGALATAILAVNNLRDRDTDLPAGKRTLAVRFGRGAARAEYVGLVAASYATPIAMWSAGVTGPRALLPLVSMPLAVAPMRLVLRATPGPALNRALAQTARLLLVFGLLFAVGLAAATR